MIEILKPDFVFDDDRGSLKQLVHDGYKQVNVITAKAGCKRGGHYHKINKEAFYIVNGSIDLTVRFDGNEEMHHFTTGDMFAIKPMVSHDFNFLSDTLLVSMYDKGVELGPNKKDIYVG